MHCNNCAECLLHMETLIKLCYENICTLIHWKHSCKKTMKMHGIIELLSGDIRSYSRIISLYLSYTSFLQSFILHLRANCVEIGACGLASGVGYTKADRFTYHFHHRSIRNIFYRIIKVWWIDFCNDKP